MWWELQTLCDEENAESILSNLEGLGALSVTTEDADADSPDEQPLFGEPGEEVLGVWGRNHITALFSPSHDPKKIIATLANAHPFLECSIRSVAEQDWVLTVQNQFEAIQVSKRLWIVPTWRTPPKDPEALILRLDPGIAFGTGSHPTTRLCLNWLERHIAKGSSLLDYGCGSGVLTLAAAKFGATRLVGVDIDPLAVKASQQNAHHNDVHADFYLSDPFPATQPFDIVIANILANPLRGLAPKLCKQMAPEGSLVLSGILEAQAQSVIDAYRVASHHQLHLEVCGIEEGWVCLSGQKSS